MQLRALLTSFSQSRFLFSPLRRRMLLGLHTKQAMGDHHTKQARGGEVLGLHTWQAMGGEVLGLHT